LITRGGFRGSSTAPLGPAENTTVERAKRRSIEWIKC
jgi:hypothetical protein